ncbi:hypothetical protein NMG60_11035662 [Bertholletia excelsa]
MFAVGFYEACRSVVSKQRHRRHKNKSQNRTKYEARDDLKSPTPNKGKRGDDHQASSPIGLFRSCSVNNHGRPMSYLSRSSSSSIFSRPSFFSKSGSRTGHLRRTLSQENADESAFSERGCSLSRSASRKEPVAASLASSFSRSSSWKEPVESLSRSISQRGTTPMMFSNSNGLVKQPASQKSLECTLEELCFGCVKRITIARDVVTDDGQLVKEKEALSVKVKPGWRKGIKVTFQGKGNQQPGTLPADIIFVIEEKKHPLYRREGDDLELAIELPLVKALTGGTLSIPLLGGEKTSLEIDEIIQPGNQKIIAGKGMSKLKEQGDRGNLIIKFQVKLSTEPTGEQRAEVSSILQHSC